MATGAGTATSTKTDTGGGVRILIVDDDQWIQRMVSTILGKRGHTVETASDGEEALGRALQMRPELVITDVIMPRMDGWAFVRAMRSRPEFALTPVIFLTALSADNDRLRGFRLGADDYLPKPFRFEELEARVATVLAKRSGIADLRAQIHAGPPAVEVPPQAGTGSPVAVPDAASEGSVEGAGSGAPLVEATDAESRSVLHGALDQIGLSSLLIMLEMERKSGVLILQQRGELGRLFLRRGRVVRARMEGAGQTLVGPEVVYHLLAWSDGRFDFSQTEVDGEDEVGNSTTFLLMEGARRIDEMNNKGRS